MKQNERLLVYAVTGFLAVILVIAVIFGNDPVDAATKNSGVQAPGLNDLLQQGRAGDAGKHDPKAGETAGQDDAKTDAEGAGLKGPADVLGQQQPLRTRPVLDASARVAQLIGPSSRDRDYRFVTVRRGDSFSSLALRWTGDVERYLEVTRRLNEDKSDRSLKPGDRICVPWVDDEALVALAEARAKPRTMIENPNRTLVDQPGGTPGAEAQPGMPRPSFLEPGRGSVNPGGANPASAAPVGGTVDYVVKNGDSLWKIAAKRYGAGKADKMVKRIQQLNGLDGATLQVKQKLKLPTSAE